jgi:hypothetical protein
MNESHGERRSYRKYEFDLINKTFKYLGSGVTNEESIGQANFLWVGGPKEVDQIVTDQIDTEDDPEEYLENILDQIASDGLKIIPKK